MIKNSSVGKDIFAGIVVFLVALPLCLGIASASGVSPLAGLISGIIGGLVVAAISRSQLSVSGPAAGLVLIVVSGITSLGYPAFLTAVFIAGVLQILFGVVGAGRLVKLVPTPVIKGMLASIGIMLIIKQLPTALGLSSAFADSHTVKVLWTADEPLFLATPFGHFSPSAVVIAMISLGLLICWDLPWAKRFRLVRFVPASIVVVLAGMVLASVFGMISPALMLPADYRVLLPAFDSWQDLLALIPSPDWRQLSQPAVWQMAVVLAVVASLESLLSVEAVEQIDPLRRRVAPNRELIAQGVGNMVTACLGALPITSVIVRSSANVYAGAQTRLSAMVHGLLLLLGLFLLPGVLRLVPLACLAAILLQTGYKLVKPSLVMSMVRSGWRQYVPFAATILGVLATDLLIGIMFGMVVSLLVMLHAHLQRVVTLTHYDNSYLLSFRKDVSFLAKPYLTKCLDSIPAGAMLIIDAERADFIDQDILEMLKSFIEQAAQQQMTIDMRNWPWSHTGEMRLATAQ